MSVPLLSVELSVEDFTRDFLTRSGTVEALEDIRFDLNKGEILGIVGESGSGKSVLSVAIMGPLDKAPQIRQGRIRFGGMDLLKSPATITDLRGRELSMTFQSPRTALNPIRRIGDQTADVAIRHGPVPRAKARAAIRCRFPS